MPDWDEDDDEDDRGDDDDSDVETRACPSCGQQVYEEAEQCPNCGEYITFSTSPLSGRPGWYVLLGLIGIAAVIFAMLRCLP